MKKERVWKDQIFRALLRDYERPEAKPEVFDSSVAGKHSAGPVIHRFIRPLRYAAIAAALVVVLGLSALYAGYDAGLASGFRLTVVTRSDETGGIRESPSGAIDSRRTLRSGPAEEFKIESEGTVLYLAPDSNIEIRSIANDFMGKKDRMVYKLESGGLYVTHDSGTVPFLIETVFGTVHPTGTALSLVVNPVEGSMILSVIEDSVIFKHVNGSSVQIVAGNNLEITKAAIGPGQRDETGGGNAVLPLQTFNVPFIPWSDIPATGGSPDREGVTETPVPGTPFSEGDRNTVNPSPDAESGVESSANGETSLTREETASYRAAAGPDVRAVPRADIVWAVRAEPVRPIWMSIAEGMVLLADANGIAAYEMQTGRQVWKQIMNAEIRSPDQGLFVLDGTELRRVDVATGKTLWTAVTGPVSFAQIAVFRGAVLVASADGTLYRIDALTGRHLAPLNVGFGMYGTPAALGDTVYFSALPADFLAMNTSKSEAMWKFTAKQRFVGDRPLIFESSGTLVVRDSGGVWYGLDVVSGVRRWEYTGGKTLVRDPEFIDGLLYWQDETGLAAIDTNGSVNRITGIDGKVLAIDTWDGGLLVTTETGIRLRNPAGVSTIMEGGFSLAAGRRSGNAVEIATLDGTGTLRFVRVIR